MGGCSLPDGSFEGGDDARAASVQRIVSSVLVEDEGCVYVWAALCLPFFFSLTSTSSFRALLVAGGLTMRCVRTPCP